jgi:hypothetical protein
MTLKFDLSQTLKIQLLGTYHGIEPDDRDALASMVADLVKIKLELLKEQKATQEIGYESQKR